MEPLHPALILVELVFAVSLMRALLVAAKVLPPSCGRCGVQMERRALGEPVCRCGLS
jgi:hypothetical protein